MKFLSVCVFSSMIFLGACANQQSACEDVTLASEQVKQCQLLQRQIVNAKQSPIIRTELERRYQKDCVDVRYYRDERQQAICGNKKDLADIEAIKN